MRFLSVCSGIEAASVAWEPLGWKAVGFSEIEPFPCAVLAHRFPNTPNYGSLTEYASWPIEPGSIDLLVGGTPCQSFSVAGLRKGMADPRGNLALVFLGLADRVKPRWIVWENVPGVLSSNGGRDFGSFLGALEQLGYGWAYRVLDAQHFGVPQRRRRVFVVACLGAGGWESAAKVLFEPESLSGDTAKGRKKGQGVAADAQGSAGTSGCWWDGGQVSQTLDAVLAKGQTMPEKNRFPAVLQPFRKSKRAQSTTDDESWVEAGEANTLNNFDLGDTRTTHAVVGPVAFTQNQRDEVRLLGDKAGALSSSGGTHQTNYIADSVAHAMPGNVAPQVYENHPNDSRVTGPLEVSPTVVSRFGTGGGNVPLVNNEPTAITFQPGNLRREAGADPSTTTTTTLKASAGDQMPHVATPMAVRRLTPTECMRLQGFPDDWARIPWKGKPADQCPDGPQYKAAGNSMAVPVMRHIGTRIAMLEAGQL